jgi:hypothetical protein
MTATHDTCIDHVRMIRSQARNMPHGAFVLAKAFEQVLEDAEHGADMLNPDQRAAYNDVVKHIADLLARDTRAQVRGADNYSGGHPVHQDSETR